MAEVKWIKIVTDIFDDEKMLLIESMPEADSIIVIWFKLLCLAGKQNNSGVFVLNDKIAYTDTMLATIFRRKLNTVKLALQTFEEFGMIEIVDKVITIPNWQKHQNMDKLEISREKTRQRVANYRQRQKSLAMSSNDCNVTVALCNADRIREEKDKEIDKIDDNNLKNNILSNAHTCEDEVEVDKSCLRFLSKLQIELNSAFFTTLYATNKVNSFNRVVEELSRLYNGKKKHSLNGIILDTSEIQEAIKQIDSEFLLRLVDKEENVISLSQYILSCLFKN